MIWAVCSYVVGMILGEFVRLSLWLRHQAKGAWLAEYWTDQRSEILLSVAVALIACYSWVEGTAMKWVVDKFGLDWPDTIGTTIIGGAAIATFAPQILRLFSRKAGLDDEPKEG